MTDEIKRILHDAEKKFKKHLTKISFLKKSFGKFDKIIGQLEIMTFSIMPEIVRLTIFKILYHNIELMRSIILELENGNFTSAEVLSRASVEYSVNITYILLDDKKDDRAKEFLNSRVTHLRRMTFNLLDGNRLM